MRCSPRRRLAAPPVACAARARGALTLAAGVVLCGAAWGCGGDPTDPSPIRGLPAALTLRVGEERVLAPTVDRQYAYEWASSDPAVASVSPSSGDCEGYILVTCRVGPGVTAAVAARAPGQTTVRVWAPDGQGTRTGHTAAVVVTVQPAAP